MRLLSYSIDGTPLFGVLDRNQTGVIDLTSRLQGVTDLSDLLRQERLDEVGVHLDAPADHQLDSVVVERLLPRPSKIFCIGVNYGGRADEYVDKSDAAFPSVFVRFPDSFTGHDQAVIRPPESPQLDYEGEIVAIIGTSGRRIPIEHARDHLAGVSLGNEGTIRDWVRHAKFNVTQGKNWNSTGAIGPHLVTMDEIPEFDELTISTHVNGERRQHDSPKTMKYSIEYQIHYLSTFTDLHPGDVIFTGTPTGAGARFDPPKWLVPGDVIQVSVPEIGVLRNHVEDEFTASELTANPITAPEPQ